LLLRMMMVVVVQNNPLKNAPHTARAVLSDKWDRPYSRELAAFPAPWYDEQSCLCVCQLLLLSRRHSPASRVCCRSKEHKFWPHVGRVDNVFGDRCAPWLCWCVAVCCSAAHDCTVCACGANVCVLQAPRVLVPAAVGIREVEAHLLLLGRSGQSSAQRTLDL
jgi:hypothetical protein